MSTIESLDTSVDLLRALLWRYNDASNLQGLLEKKQIWYDGNQEQFWVDWVRDVFDLNTANDFGLMVWAIILGVPLFADDTATNPNKPTWGFGQYNQNFNRGNFFGMSSNAIPLDQEQKRAVLKLRYYQLTTNGTVTEINRMLKTVFTGGSSFVVDNNDMTIIYVFEFDVPSNLLFALEKFDVLPRPAGVKLTIKSAAGPKIFAWNTSDVFYGGWGTSVWS